HTQVKNHAPAEKRLDLGARRGAEGFDGSAALADDDPFLAVAFDVEHRPNIYRLGALPELIDLTRDAVGQLFMQLLEGGFANEFRRKEAHRLGGQLVGIIMKGAFGKPGTQGLEKLVQALPRDCGERDVGRLDGRTVFANKCVEQRRFADVGPAGQNDGAATGHGSKCRIEKPLTRGPYEADAVLRARAVARSSWWPTPASLEMIMGERLRMFAML